MPRFELVCPASDEFTKAKIFFDSSLAHARTRSDLPNTTARRALELGTIQMTIPRRFRCVGHSLSDDATVLYTLGRHQVGRMHAGLESASRLASAMVLSESRIPSTARDELYMAARNPP